MRHRRIALISSVLIALAITLLAWVGLSANAFEDPQRGIVDRLFPASDPDARIAVVLIDERSLTEVGRWPWDRSVHADLIRAIARRGADRIGYDVTFTEPSDPDADRALSEAIDEARNVVMAGVVEFGGEAPRELPAARSYFPPIEQVRDGALDVGHVHVNPDRDGIVRALAPVVATPDDQLLPAISLSLALSQPEKEQLSLAPNGVRTLDGVIPTGDAHLMDLNFAEGFASYAAIDVLKGDVPNDAFDGRLVLVGASALGLGDYQKTALNKDEGQPGVLVHANALNTILTGSYLRPDSTATTLIWVFVISLLVALGVSYLRLLITPLAPIVVGSGAAYYAFRRFDGGAVTNLVYPVFAVGLSTVAAIGTRYFTELRERQRVTKVFSRYLSKDVVDEVLAAPADAVATLEGASPEISVLFADLRGFTSASEQLPPTKVVTALNMFLDAMTRAVIEEQGTVDKFMGDCVMAFWNAPRREPRHAERAVRAALLMQRYIDEAMQIEEVAALPVRGCGVGVATGEAVVGNIGSAQRLDYTVIGDTVNTASRLCGVAEAGEVVITEACAQAVGHAFELSAMPPVSVKGKEEPLRVFRVSALGVNESVVTETGPGSQDGVGPVPKAAGYAPVEPAKEETGA
ncbi:MAG: CHASE2 domain-containing protein [Actinomycetota bacterium]